TKISELAIPHVKVEPRDELAVAPAGDEHRFAHPDDVGPGIVRVRRQNHVDACDALGELAVDVETIVGEQYDEPGPLPACLFDVRPDVLFTDPERPRRDHPARIGYCRERKGLAQHRDFHAPLLERAVGIEYGLVPIRAADIEREEWIAQSIDQLLHSPLAIG